MSKHDLQIKEYPATEDYSATTVVACLDHDKQEAYYRRRTADLEAIIDNNEVYICCNDEGCEGERGCERNLLNAIGMAYDAGAASIDRKAIAVEVIRSAPKHEFWGAGEPDCPPEIKARNGELHTLRCKHCDNPKYPICVGQMEVLYGGTR